jgi:Secretion system C-terminal sorting domain
MKRYFMLVFFLATTYGLNAQGNVRVASATTSTTTTTTAPAATVDVPPPPTYNSITFAYDVNGNQKWRKLIYLSARPGNPNTPPPQQPVVFTKSDLYEDVLYYPNPVVEILTVKWKNDELKQVNSIDVFDISGASLRNYRDLKDIQTTEIDFQTYPSGLYVVLLQYSDGEQKTLKVVKK